MERHRGKERRRPQPEFKWGDGTVRLSLRCTHAHTDRHTHMSTPSLLLQVMNGHIRAIKV